MKTIQSAILFGMVLTALPVHAHHTSALYMQQEEISITGKVVRYQWSNPHVYLWVDGKIDGGDRTLWEIESQPPTVLRRMGITRESLHVGDSVTVKAQPGRDPEQHKALMVSLKKSDDSILDTGMQAMITSLSSNDAPTTERAKGVTGTWITLANFPAVFKFVDTSNLPRTEQGIAAVASFVETKDSPALNCVPAISPLLMITPDIKSIEMSAETLVIRGEFDNSTRTVHMDQESHEGAASSIQGHSIGHWENGVLVIDTAHFNPHRTGNGAGLPSGPDRHLVERLTPDETGTKLTYSFTLEDPDYFTMPVTGEAQWEYRPDLTFESLPCDIDNARRFAQ